MAGRHEERPDRFPYAERREVLRQAIGDIQGSIHANDSKSAAGLVVHGLLATAVLSLATKLGPVYADANGTAQWLIRWTLIGALLLAVASIACLVMAIIPYHPREVTERMYGPEHSTTRQYRKLFFPDIVTLKDTARFGKAEVPGPAEREVPGPAERVLQTKARQLHRWLRREGANWRYALGQRRDAKGDDEYKQLQEMVDQVDDPAKLEAEYVAELVEVADIREHEARWARRGFWLLLAEVMMVVGYLGTVGAVAGHLLGASG